MYFALSAIYAAIRDSLICAAKTHVYYLLQKPRTLWAMLQCSLSQRERVRVRGFSHGLWDPHPPPSPSGRGSYGPCPKRLPETALCMSGKREKGLSHPEVCHVPAILR